MADEEYNRKLESLQQYIPFLNNMIVQLKDPRKKNREQQLAKMVSLHSMITDKKKKLKLETLTKCEDVILKLYEKVKSGSGAPNMGSKLAPTSAYSPMTPSSPSPPREVLKTKPVVIPTEKVPDRLERDLFNEPSSFKNRVDIYSSAADSLKAPIQPQKVSVFERLGRRAPDMSKPPISIEDLEALQRDVITERLSLNELTDLREKLQKQLKTSEENEEGKKSPINTTVRNTTILTKKAVEKSVSEVKSKAESKLVVAKVSPVAAKTVKVVKEASSVFGSALSSIDTQIIEGASKSKEKERRNSSEKSKERRSSKEDRKTGDTSSSSSHRSKDRGDKHKSNDGDKVKSKDGDRDKSKDRKEHKNRDDSKEHKSRDDSKEHKSRDDLKEHKSREDSKKHESSRKDHDKKNHESVKKDEQKTEENKKPETENKPKPEEPKLAEPAPVYKRLADKYNPKPRKPTTVDVTHEPKKPNTIEITPTPIPFLELPPKSPIKAPMPTLPPISLPLPSPTNSSSMLDSEVAAFNRKSLLPTPPSNLPIPSHVSNLLSNPSTSALINTVVNQFKARQAPLPVPPQTPKAYAYNYPPTNNPQGTNYPATNNPQGTSYPSANSPQGNNYPSANNPQNNYWPRPQQPQHFGQRPFTPIANQFENQMQNMDYYPPGNTPTHNQFSHQPPPMLSPHYDGYEPRPLKHDDRDSRYRDDWRRPVPSPTPYRDPRLQRDVRDNRDRDFRSHREDPRMMSRRDSRDYERPFRDPRLNRYEREPSRSEREPTSRYEREPTRFEREPNRPEREPNRFEREREQSVRPEPPRQWVRSTSKETEEGTFMSPLDSLYSGNNYRKTGKGYGVQNFKIPKIKKETEVEEEKEPEEEVPKEEKDEPPPLSPQEETKLVEPEPEAKKPEIETQKPELEAKKPDDKASEVQETKEDESVASTSVSSSTECEDKPEDPPEVAKPPAEVGEISSTNDIQDSQPKPLDVESQTDIINKFLKKLLENERTRAAASMFIDNVSSSLDDDKLKMVVQTVKAATVEEEKPPERPATKKKKVVKKMTKLGAKLAVKKRQAVRRKLTLQKRKKKKQQPVVQEDEDEEADKEEEEVVVSVGERIKSRKRTATTNAQKRKRFKHKTELDLLHEDIQDMFIRDGVLTATGKRMCRLLKNDEVKSPVVELKRRTRNSSEKFDSKVSPDKLKAMSNVRVLIPKMSMEELDDEAGRYLLRRSKSGKNYAEFDSEEEKEKPKPKEEPKVEEKKEKKIQPEETVEMSKEPTCSPKKVKKRAKSWASGVLPKRKKKVAEEKEDLNKSMELVEPDKNYFSAKQWHSKSTCKLCDYDGMNITRHYKVQHPDSEVLSARLSPGKAEDAIKKSLELKLTDKEDVLLNSGKRQQFVCRFCDLEMNAQPGNFYDHISTHTGEYRHLCKKCDFISCGPKPLRAHYIKMHSMEKYEKPVGVKAKIYGYICVECNFVQMVRKTVENHVNVYHLGEDKEILKVHLSTIDDYPKEVESQEEAEEEDDEEEEEQPKVKRKKFSEKVGKKEVVKVKATDNAPEVAIAVPPTPAPPAPPKPPPPTPPPPIKKEKEIDMTVFTCNTNIQEENEKIEQERLRKMAELNESVKTNRQSLNFVDQLSSRLLQEQEQKAPPPEIVTVKDEPMDELLPEETTLPVLEREPEPEPLLEVASKKPNKLREAPVLSHPVVQKDNAMIQGMIQKLQGILKEEKPAEGPPPLMPLQEKTDEKVFLSAGFLNISKSSNGLEYACRVPSCLFTSTNRDSFVMHWEEDHTRINQSYKVSKCRICQKDVMATVNRSLLSNFFAHVENEHLCGIKTSFNAGFMAVERDRDGYTYMCCLHLCLFSTTNRDNFVSHLDEHHTANATVKTTKCGICESAIQATPETHILATLFHHLESVHLEDDSYGPSAPKVLRTRRLSGDKLSTTKEECPELKEEEDNPFPFKISGVMSLATEESVPPLTPLGSSPKVENVILKESKMTTVEKAATWKCNEAMKKFLQCPRELYKCPQYFCKYVTSWRHLFENHVKAHARVSDELVSCVYCDVKTPLSHAGLHIDLRHSNCLYSCSQCLYRALTREYVVIHNRLKHKENDLIVVLPQKTLKTIMVSKPKHFTVKEACQPYKCGCSEEFLFLSEFCSHLHNCQNGFMTCGFAKCNFQCLVVENMIDHWRLHGCYHFHCLVCKMGCMEMYSMLEHYSTTHPNMEPTVVDRRNSPVAGDESEPTVYGYTESACSRIRHLKEELLESVTVNQISVLTTDKPQFLQYDSKLDSPKQDTPKNVTLVPLSILQPNSTEPKKIIAIIPNKVDAISSKLFVNKDTAAPFIFASTSEDKDEPKDDTSIVDDGDAPVDTNADPLSLDAEIGNVVSASGDESDSPDLLDTVDMKSFGFVGYQLYRCAFCDISFSNARDFKAHTVNSKNCRNLLNAARQFKCVHCERQFKNAHGLLEHIQYHGPLRFGCSLCVKKFPSSFSLKVHMRNKHNVTNTVTTPVIPNKTNLERDEFILRPVQSRESDVPKEGPSVQNSPNQKSVYGPEEVDQLPKRYIFSSNIKCALCSYSTKVRTNLVRHLQFHSSEKSVPDIAPVNPVPCLDKNERMFDKMTNLAISSMTGAHTSRMSGAKPETKVSKEEEHPELPIYIPANRRYVCCAEGCNYLCPEESNLRHHLHALHVQEAFFTCSHCKLELKPDVDLFMKHLKLHDLHLYKCSDCSFVHNLRHKVEKHVVEKGATVITVRSLETELVESEPPVQSVSTATVPSVDTPQPANIKFTKPWHCGMCKYRCAAKHDMVSHIYNKHNINAQFKCTLCSYKTDEKPTFEHHFKCTHPDNEIDIIHVYYKSEGASGATGQKHFDTTPLWQRDRPRVRHIRGILFEETSPQKIKKVVVAKATPTASTSTSSNLDLAIDAVAKGIDEAAKTVKTKESEPVIVIDDEEDVEEPQDQTMNDSVDNELLIDMDIGEEPNVKQEKTSEEFLSEEMLFKKFGELCPAGAKGFMCPRCYKYKNKKVGPFVHHMLTEFNCNRFKCKSCEFVAVTFDAMVAHCKAKHDSKIISNVMDTPIARPFEYWLQLVITHQAKELVKVMAMPTGEESATSSCKNICEYCQKWFKTMPLLKDHELCHWATHSYTCEHCLSDHVSLNELFQHTLLTHPQYDVSFTTKGPYVGRVISTLKTPQAPTAAGDETIEYTCSICGEVESTMEGLRKHANECHEGEELACKVVTKVKVEAMYCCTYCHERAPDKVLREHHKEKHPGTKFEIYQYICMECSGTYLNLKDLRAHFSKSHVGKKLTYSCIENKRGGNKDQYCCTKCPFRSSTMGGIRSHLRKHLRPIECLTCGATFIFPTEARAHHNKEHIHSAERVEENKEKLLQYEELVKQIVDAKTKGIIPKSATAQPPRKMMARKSTGAPFVRPEYSFYGTKKEETDLKSVTTSIE